MNNTKIEEVSIIIPPYSEVKKEAEKREISTEEVIKEFIKKKIKTPL